MTYRRRAAARACRPESIAAMAMAGLDPLLLRAYRGEPVERVPVWFMRQAGRCLPEYRAIRKHAGLLEICRTPDLAAEVTLQPVRRLGVDAAILFSDILLPLKAAGVELEIAPGIGPVIAHPLREERDFRQLRSFRPEYDAPYVAEAVELVLRELDDDAALVGFAGAPFTLASYLIEGGPSKTLERTRALMYGNPSLWQRLLDAMADVAIASLRSQIAAGVHAVQLFDTWAGVLDPYAYAELALPATRRVFQALDGEGVPRVHFGVCTGGLLELLAAAGADVVGVDWRVPLGAARERLGAMPVQGNLDPAACLAPWDALAAHVDVVLEGGGGVGHVFNLGHGVLPQTSPDALARIVERVHERSAAPAAAGAALEAVGA